jgi:hypothetical protein
LLSIAALGPLSGSAGAQAPGCPPYPAELSLKGGGGARFTMLVRVNKLENVTQYDALQGARGQFRPRDIFVVNTRFRGLEDGEAEQIAERLHEAFPCNRIVALNGLGADPNRPGYLFALADNPLVWGTMLDWEQRDWRAARATNPAMSSWKRHFGRSFSRLKQRVGELANTLNGSPGVGPRRAGVVPTYYHDWNYGRIAKMLDQRNRRLGHARGGIQVVATQAACQKRKRGDEERSGIRPRARELFRQYGKHNRKKRNLALQVSFSRDAKAHRGLPIRSVNDARASKCIRHAVRRGAGAFLLWASPESMIELFHTSRFRKLRPPVG